MEFISAHVRSDLNNWYRLSHIFKCRTSLSASEGAKKCSVCSFPGCSVNLDISLKDLQSPSPPFSCTLQYRRTGQAGSAADTQPHIIPYLSSLQYSCGGGVLPCVDQDHGFRLSPIPSSSSGYQQPYQDFRALNQMNISEHQTHDRAKHGIL